MRRMSGSLSQSDVRAANVPASMSCSIKCRAFERSPCWMLLSSAAASCLVSEYLDSRGKTLWISSLVSEGGAADPASRCGSPPGEVAPLANACGLADMRAAAVNDMPKSLARGR